MRPYSSYASNAQRRMRTRPNGARKWGVNNNMTLESHGPNVKIRGTAVQIAERYLSLARDALGSDRVKAESYYQHAEHYIRLASQSQNAHSERGRGGMSARQQHHTAGAGTDDKAVMENPAESHSRPAEKMAYEGDNGGTE